MVKNRVELVDFELLSRCGLLTDIPTDLLGMLLQAGNRKHLEAKEVVFNRGEPGNKIYFILNGGVRISTLSHQGQEIIFDVLVTGDFFGEMSLFDDKPRTGTVTTLVPTTLFTLGKNEFLESLEKCPAISIRLIRTLVNRLRMMDSFIEDVIFLDAAERIAKRIIALARLFGVQGDKDEIRIDLKVSQQELANLVGITRESVNKQFREWEKSGVIALDKGCLILSQPQFLETLVAKRD
ncbi:MAG: Crp/Fnr family transcriptional regulator [Proteobacteria bacterium]|nr:Crp/Fnr family transcriptional regulator [Pseudomonadota bacterium]